jgi:hypothetical protein
MFSKFLRRDKRVPVTTASCGWRNGLQYGGLLRKYWINSRGQPTRGGPPAGWLGEVLTTTHRKTGFLAKQEHLPGTWIDNWGAQCQRCLSHIFMVSGNSSKRARLICKIFNHFNIYLNTACGSNIHILFNWYVLKNSDTVILVIISKQIL